VRIAIVNYGMGNLASVRRAFEDLGADCYVADRPQMLEGANRIVLPGVGAFRDGMDTLAEGGWVDGLRRAVLTENKPLLGICLGMQMLATRSHEGGMTEGLGFIPGEVHRLDTLGCRFRIPHVGWNEVVFRGTDHLDQGIPDRSDFYFVHSFGLVPEREQDLLATAPYGCEVAAIVRSGNVFGCQFHPEKSSKAGRRLLRNFVDYVAC
jgi:imidazole glycerol-phosphate synthase subunit HisH